MALSRNRFYNTLILAKFYLWLTYSPFIVITTWCDGWKSSLLLFNFIHPNYGCRANYARNTSL